MNANNLGVLLQQGLFIVISSISLMAIIPIVLSNRCYVLAPSVPLRIAAVVLAVQEMANV